MTFNEFNLYPGIVVDSLDQIDNVLNDPTIEDHVFVPGDLRKNKFPTNIYNKS